MKQELIVQLHASFEQLVHKEEDSGVEFWLARDLQKVLGYDRWENFEKVIGKAITACEKSGYDAKDHFLEITKMISMQQLSSMRSLEQIAESRLQSERSFCRSRQNDPPS